MMPSPIDADLGVLLRLAEPSRPSAGPECARHPIG